MLKICFKQCMVAFYFENWSFNSCNEKRSNSIVQIIINQFTIPSQSETIYSKNVKKYITVSKNGSDHLFRIFVHFY